MTRMFFISLILIVGLSGSLAAQTADGGYAGSFLQVPIGARPAAMGGAYLAVSDDAAGALFNPAGLSDLKQTLLGTSYRAMKLDRSLGYATVIFPVQGNSALGIHWLYAGSGSVEARDDDGYALGHDLSFNSHDFSAVFAKKFEKFFSAGTKINYYQTQGPEVSAFSVGFDFGFMLHVDQLFRRDRREQLRLKDTQIGLTVKYLSVTYRWNDDDYEAKYGSSGNVHEQSDKVPMEIGLGASTKLMDRKLLVATDVIKNEKQNPEFHAGTEYRLSPQFLLRTGWGDGRFGAGTGYQFDLGSRQLSIDYAFSTAKADEGSEHIFSFEVRF